jgi:Na+/H+ antiporter NhaD/arsenite permease-like protein
MNRIFQHLDFPSLLFFCGILLAVAALESAGILHALARLLEAHVPNVETIATIIGLASAVVDNVPLVAASMGMYSMEAFPIDHTLWLLIAYCAGTGGSILIIGSAAGVVYMGIEKVTFTWFLRRASLPALLGYLAGIGAYLVLN